MTTVTVHDHPAAAPLPAPPNFPVTWEHPDDVRLFWALDRMHCPEPITPMSDVFIRLFCDATNATLQTYEMPMRLYARRINTYHYLAQVPKVAPPEEMASQAARSQAKVGAAMAQLYELWATEWLPEVQRHLADWEAFDLQGAALPALLEHLDDTIARYRRIWEIHCPINTVSLVAMAAFDDLYQSLFDDASALSSYRLLQGFDNQTLASGRALWQLSRQALAAPEVRAICETTAPANVLTALDQTPTGRTFRAALQAYLEEYGRRSSMFFELAAPSWIEDPTPVIQILQGFLSQTDRDPEAERAALAAERERLVATARERLKHHPPEAVGQFEFLLKAAQTGTVLMEDHAFWIDFRAMYEVRRVLFEFGRRFAAAGVLEQAVDVFYVTIDELRESATALPMRDRRRLVAGRRAETAYFRTITPPAALGTPPQVSADDPTARLAAKFFGAPPAAQERPDVVRGSAGSAGVARGRARVIRSLADTGTLQKGDILVAPTTSPPWTPLFATVAAVVTDTGGVLSHSAIVAREYGIPAVVGTGSATTIIRDGQLIEVDGSAGIVRIVTSL